MSDTLEMMGSEHAEADGLAHSIAAAGLQVSQAADELREAAERLMRAEDQAAQAEARAHTAQEQLEQGATKNAELLEMLQAAREGQTEADERRRRAEDRVADLEAASHEVEATVQEARTRAEEAEATAREAEARAGRAEEQLALVAAQNAELLTLVERAQEERADGDEEARHARQRLDEETERANALEQRLRDLEARMQETAAEVPAAPVTLIVADEERSALRESVAAEVRRPLTSILGLALALKHADGASPDAKDMVRQLATNARKLDRLVGQMLDLDKIEKGTFVPNRRRTDLEAMVRRVIEESQDLAKRDVHIEAEHVAIGVDPQLTEQMVDALLANAAKRTAPGNPVWVKIQAESGGVVIAVEDTGAEVPDGLRSAMFAALGDSGPAHGPRGSTGLSLLARLAEVHGGSAWVEERPGGGASFRVFLADQDGEASSPGATGRPLALVRDPDRGVEAPEATPETDGHDEDTGGGGLPDLQGLREILTS
ncbi:MAG TPA: ATP-binding protein [Actinomycetota bacterium]|nr:ATP-binding protein [Actinomycetota bacterium]